jgi:hypothetical protein
MRAKRANAPNATVSSEMKKIVGEQHKLLCLLNVQLRRPGPVVRNHRKLSAI